MLYLRPHHLLCLMFYEGKGYNEEFVQNMNGIIVYLQQHQTVKILLTDGADSICSSCPNLMKNGQCLSNQKVERLDKEVIHTFELKTGAHYNYHQITNVIYQTLNRDNFKKLCSECEWYKQGICGKEII